MQYTINTWKKVISNIDRYAKNPEIVNELVTFIPPSDSS